MPEDPIEDQAQEQLQDLTEAILDRHLDRDMRVFPMAEGTTSPAQVDAVAKRLGVKYPAEFSTHVCGRFPGIYVEAKESVWPRPKPFDGGSLWSFLYALHTFTASIESDGWMQLLVAAETFQRETQLVGVAPILKVVGDSNVFCVDATGRIVRFNDEEDGLEPVDLTFWELFEREVAELCARKERKQCGE